MRIGEFIFDLSMSIAWSVLIIVGFIFAFLFVMIAILVVTDFLSWALG